MSSRLPRVACTGLHESVVKSLLLFGTFSLLCLTAASADRVTSKRGSLELPEGVIEYEWPSFPYLARLHGLDGYGIYRLNVGPDGEVSSVETVKTTTHKIFDDAAIKAFRKWRFLPNSARQVTLPVTFIMRGEGHRMSEARRLAIRAPAPERQRSSRSGSGTYRFIVDYESGHVRDVQVIKPSGRPSFDAAVVKAYRQWRFMPRSVRTIDTTAGFAP